MDYGIVSPTKDGQYTTNIFTSPLLFIPTMQRYNAVHIRQSPNLRQAIRDAVKDNTVLFGTLIGLPSPDVARVIAATDSDWICLDAEHTPYSPTLFSEMVRLSNLDLRHDIDDENDYRSPISVSTRRDVSFQSFVYLPIVTSGLHGP